MNGIEKITARIAAEAQAEAAKIIAAAHQQAEHVRADYENKAQEEYLSLVNSASVAAKQQSQRQSNNANLEGRKALLALKQQLISKAYSKAQEKILSLPDEEYVAFLAKLAGDASVSGDEEIVLNERDRERIGEKLVEAANSLLKERGLVPGLKLSDTVRKMTGGLILRKGAVDINCTLELLTDMSRSSLDAEIAAILFG